MVGRVRCIRSGSMRAVHSRDVGNALHIRKKE